jgi:hypothetical protein
MTTVLNFAFYISLIVVGYFLYEHAFDEGVKSQEEKIQRQEERIHYLESRLTLESAWDNNDWENKPRKHPRRN